MAVEIETAPTSASASPTPVYADPNRAAPFQLHAVLALTLTLALALALILCTAPPTTRPAITGSSWVKAESPPMPRTNDELNHAVLRRYYPDIDIVLSIAPYAVLYQFSPPTSTWIKTEIEGSLFINALSPSPLGAERFNVVILNRRGWENFQQELSSSEDVEVTTDYVIMRGENGQVWGLWIFAEEGTSTADSRVVNAKVIEECARRAEESGNRAQALAAQGQENMHLELGNGYAAEPESDVEIPQVQNGRQMSLAELFGKQREADGAFALNHHESAAFQEAQPAASSPAPAPLQEQRVPNQTKKTPTPFATNADTDFFRSGSMAPKQTQQPAAPSAPAPGSSSSNPLLDILRGVTTNG